MLKGRGVKKPHITRMRGRKNDRRGKWTWHEFWTWQTLTYLCNLNYLCVDSQSQTISLRKDIAIHHETMIVRSNVSIINLHGSWPYQQWYLPVIDLSKIMFWSLTLDNNKRYTLLGPCNKIVLVIVYCWNYLIIHITIRRPLAWLFFIMHARDNNNW